MAHDGQSDSVFESTTFPSVERWLNIHVRAPGSYLSMAFLVGCQIHVCVLGKHVVGCRMRARDRSCVNHVWRKHTKNKIILGVEGPAELGGN